jgi:D-alanyl-D-alanine dipeptidase
LLHPRLFNFRILARCLFLTAWASFSVFAQPPNVAVGSALRAPELVELTRLDSTIHLDIRYATSRNFMGMPMYSIARAFLQRPAAEALVSANRAVAKHGFGLLVFDAYRPWSVTKAFWDSVVPAKRSFVADPAKGSVHNRGCAVDLSLYDLATGKEVVMPSPFDDFTRRASPRYGGGTVVQRRRRDFLRRIMEEAGFSVNKGEWWHFDYKDWRKYPILNVPLENVSP